MARLLALHFDDQAIHVAIARDQIARRDIEFVATLPVPDFQDPGAVGRKLAELLHSHRVGKAKVIAAVNRDTIQWNYQSLPPSPHDELADLVRMQVDLDARRADEGTGYDFISLSGDEEHPHQVLTVTLAAAHQTTIHKICRAADLKLAHVVPLVVGWPALAKLADNSAALQLFLALQHEEATIWATIDGKLKLFRQVQLPKTVDRDPFHSAVESQLRRSLLALPREGQSLEGASVRIVGGSEETVADLASHLRSKLDLDVTSFVPPSEVAETHSGDAVPFERYPLVGLALATAGGPPLVDFLHPHRGAPKQSNRRTAVLAALTACVLVGAGAWQGYQTLQEPIRKAEQARAELELLEESMPEFSDAEAKASQVRDWLSGSPNVLTELHALSKTLRPAPLEDEAFSAEEDIVLKRLEFSERRASISGNVTASKAVQPLESRLRASGAERVRRERSEPEEENSGYPWHVQIMVELPPRPVAEEPSS